MTRTSKRYGHGLAGTHRILGDIHRLALRTTRTRRLLEGMSQCPYEDCPECGFTFLDGKCGNPTKHE